MIELCKDIGKLLKAADDIQLQYYQQREEMNKDDVPKTLVGDKCLKMICENPDRGLNFLKNRIDPFMRFCNAKGIKFIATQDEKVKKKGQILFGKIKKYNVLMEKVAQATMKRLSIEEQNCIIINYYS